MHPYTITNVGIEMSDWPEDDLFQTWPVFFMSNRLCAKTKHGRYSGIDFQPVHRIHGDYNFSAFYPGFEFDQYFLLNISDKVGRDDFALYKRMYLVVSEKALAFLRSNHVVRAEADEIDMPFDKYFGSDRKDFWLHLSNELIV